MIADSHTWIAPTPQSIPVYVLPPLTRKNFPNRYISSVHKTIRILKNIKPDFVHLHAQHYYSPAIILSGIPFMLTSWGTEVLTLPNENIMIKILAKSVFK